MSDTTISNVTRGGGATQTTVMFWHRPAWGAIIAGTVVASSAQILFALLGVAIGLTAFDAYTQPNYVDWTTPPTSAAIWWLLTGTIAMFLGGLVVGRFGGVTRACDISMQAVTTWATTAILGGLVVGGIIGVAGAGTMVGMFPFSPLWYHSGRTQSMAGTYAGMTNGHAHPSGSPDFRYDRRDAATSGAVSNANSNMAGGNVNSTSAPRSPALQNVTNQTVNGAAGSLNPAASGAANANSANMNSGVGLDGSRAGEAANTAQNTNLNSAQRGANTDASGQLGAITEDSLKIQPSRGTAVAGAMQVSDREAEIGANRTTWRDYERSGFTQPTNREITREEAEQIRRFARNTSWLTLAGLVMGIAATIGGAWLMAKPRRDIWDRSRRTANPEV